MKPAVLPGESMRALILREGKESTQGVAYLDDGTMVVFENARRFPLDSAPVLLPIPSLNKAVEQRALSS